MKKLLLDTANVSDISLYCQTDAVCGVTTNPALVSKEARAGRSYEDVLVDIISASKFPFHPKEHFSIEVTTSNPSKMLSEALELVDKVKDVVPDRNTLHVKIPLTVETLSVISELRRYGVKVNATAIMTMAQAALAEQAGANVISFFYNRMTDPWSNDVDKNRVLDEINKYVKLRNENTSDVLLRPKIICGSIRTVTNVLDAWQRGADYVTVSPKILREMAQHDQTDKAIKEFQEKIDTWLK